MICTKKSAFSALVLFFALSCTAMHAIQPGLSPVDEAVSYYMNGALGWVLGLGLVSLGVASILLATNIRSASRPGVLLLGIWGAGCIIGGVFPPDPPGHWDQPPSLSGMVHGVAAMVAFLAFPPAALLLSSSRAILKPLATLCAVATIVFIACLMPAFLDRPPIALGLAERVALALYVCWLLAANYRITPQRPTGGSLPRCCP